MVEGVAFLCQLANSSSMVSSLKSAPDNPEKAVLYGPMGVLIFAVVQGLAVGVVFCNTYWKVMNQPLPPAVYDALDEARARKGMYRVGVVEGTGEDEAIGLLEGVASRANERDRGSSRETALREFLLSAVAPPDVISVTIASLFGMVLQQLQCFWQASHGRRLCKV